MPDNIPVFLASDNNYSPFVATTMASIISNTKSFINFYILDSGITDANKEIIKGLKGNYSIEFITVNPETEYKDLKCKIGVEHITTTAYNRLLIPKLKPQLKKVIYLDVDIIVLGDICELYNQSLDNYTLGAIWNEKRKLFDLDSKEIMEFSNNYKYFNSGVLMIDIPKWNSENILEKLFIIEKKYREKILHGDETLLNKCFDNNYKVLDIQYNYLDYDVINNPDIRPLIRHYATPMKPWKSNYCFAGKKVIPLANFDDFWKYAKMTDFYDTIKEIYEKEINKSPLTKRLSLIVKKG